MIYNTLHRKLKIVKKEAVIKYSPTEISPPIIAEKIDDMGFPAKIKTVHPATTDIKGDKSEHKTEINIKGMTCMSCVRNIENNICRIKSCPLPLFE
jgi:Cu+-exporting ATPase